MKLNLQTLGILIGVISGIISIPPALINAYQITFHKPMPKLEVKPSKSISFSSNASRTTITVSFGLLLYNKGDANEEIQSSNVYFGMADDPKLGITFTDESLVFKQGENDYDMQRPIRKDQDQSIRCEFTSSFNDLLRHMFMRQEKPHALLIEMVGQNSRQTYKAKLQFDLGADVSASFLNPAVQPINQSIACTVEQ
jgi:hypothetical protein